MIVISTQPDSSAPITSFEPHLAALCPETARILLTARLTVHPRVTAITLHGSRGPAGGYRPDSDVDLCLIVETTGVTERVELATLLRSALHTTLEYWQGAVEADLAQALEVGYRGFGKIACTAAAKEGISAFLERRKPEFKK